jgi:nitrous oxidase accessory protein
MYSRNLTLRHNVISANRGPSGYAIGLKDVDDAVIEENLVHDNRVGAFVDTSPREVESTVRWTGNVFAYNDVGLDLMPSISRNYFTANSFVENEQQVSIAGGGLLRGNFWSVADRGNYWSDYAGYDGDGDGVGDLPYKTERLFENLMDTQPALRLFLYSPVEQAVDFAARAVPFVRPQPTLTDEAPLMAPIMPAGLPQAAEAGREPLLLASAAMVAVAFLLLGLDSFRKYRVGQGWALDWPAWPASAAPVIPNQSDSHG